MRALALSVVVAGLAGGVAAQEVAQAPGGVVRVLDKTGGEVIDLTLATGETGRWERLEVTMRECRYPVGNPTGDAFALLSIDYEEEDQPLFTGWMIASAPALNPMDNPRYDVWVLRCTTS